ncbi:hypothetical protein DIPPA_31623 [Diplonema papillatum]|nr:hypothetical protein DIPPA_31623 [Diplonema papillatum]
MLKGTNTEPRGDSRIGSLLLAGAVYSLRAASQGPGLWCGSGFRTEPENEPKVQPSE